MVVRKALGVLAVALIGGACGQPVGVAEREVDPAGSPPSIHGLPLAFVANGGWLDPAVAYSVHGSQESIYFTDRGPTFALAREGGGRWVVKVDFVRARAVRPVAGEAAGWEANDLHGDASRWTTGMTAYRSITYPDVWPGIDLVYSGDGARLKYQFLVHPGADAGAIALAYRGVTSVQVDRDGRLVVGTPARTLTDDAPIAYQERGGARVPVDAAYALGPAAADGAQYGFHLGAYDASRPLVIDPAVLVYSGYLDDGEAIAVDAKGDAYVAGSATSPHAGFPCTPGFELGTTGDVDAVVAKVKRDGSGLVYVTYLGGAQSDFGRAIAVDAHGHAYVAGYTTSDETSFPVTVGPGRVYSGNTDAFVAKLSARGSSLAYAGYVGGAETDIGFALAVDRHGRAYLAGSTMSDQTTFPVRGGPSLVHGAPGFDAFAARVAPSGAELDYAGYIGGDGQDEAFAIALDARENAYLAGWTNSTAATFPVRGGPSLTLSGGFDAWVGKIDRHAHIEYAGYVGGARDEAGYGLAVDRYGAAYVVGFTASDATTFPVRIGPSTTSGGADDAFIAKVAPHGDALVYAGFVGGTGFESALGVAVDSAGRAWMTGATNTADGTFPAHDWPYLTNHGGDDAFVSAVAADGSGLVASGFFGGSGTDAGRDIALGRHGGVYVSGLTNSTDLPTKVGPSFTPREGFVAKFDVAARCDGEDDD